MHLTQEEERLAVEIAHALDDMDSLQWHRQMVSLYSETHLRKWLRKVLAIPSHKVISSRAAIYNSQIQKHGSGDLRA